MLLFVNRFFSILHFLTEVEEDFVKQNFADGSLSFSARVFSTVTPAITEVFFNKATSTNAFLRLRFMDFPMLKSQVFNLKIGCDNICLAT